MSETTTRLQNAWLGRPAQPTAVAPARWMREHAVYADHVRLDLVGVRLDVSGPGRFDHVRGVG